MIELENRTILDDGTVICKESAIIELLYQGKSIDNALAEQSASVELYNNTSKILDTGFEKLETTDKPIYQDINWMEYWFTPEPYNELDIRALCLDRCKNQEERARALKELDLFYEKGMFSVLRHLVYIVDVWRSKNIVWGVGRGSSVSSFVLYLIGINRINPMEWNLEIEEFLK